MKSHNLELINNQRNQVKVKIDTLNMSEEWKEIFKTFCSYRGWITLRSKHQKQMENIASVNSQAVKPLLEEGLKLTGMDLIEFIAVELLNESIRRKAVNILINKGVGKGKEEVLTLSLSPENESQKSRN